jgi:beta-lactamase class D
MHKILIFLWLIVFGFNSWCAEDTFVLYDIKNNKVVVSEGAPDTQLSPYSSFKIALSLMGFESKLLHDASSPVWKYKPEHEPWTILDSHRQDMTPEKWIKYSCVWFSQELTRTLGKKEFQRYVNLLHYGNQDLSGEPEKDNGLTESWLGSSLKISANEQIAFMCKLATQGLPFSVEAQQITRKIMCLGDQGNGWILYGKTGAGFQKNTDGSKNPEFWMGWFVGWIEKGDSKYAFASQVNNVKRSRGSGGQVAKEIALKRIKELFIEGGLLEKEL